MADTTDDTDGDGLTDGAEIHIHNTNPDLADSDSDGLTDGEEIALQTDPNDPDTDNDGSTDGDEILYGTAVLDETNRLLQISGELTYEGKFDGEIFLVIEHSGGGDPKVHSMGSFNLFTITRLPNHLQYKVWAFMDLNGDEEYQFDIEPIGALFSEFSPLQDNLDNQTIQLEDANNAPEDILLDNNQVLENSPIQTTIGSIIPVDPDDDDTFTFQLVEDPEGGSNDNHLFAIEGNSLVTTESLDYEATPTLTIHIQVTDSYMESVTKSFTIQVTNLFTAILTTNTIEDLEDGTFRASGKILHNGGADIVAQGVVYGTSPGLTLSSPDAKSTVSILDGSTIESVLSGLTPDRTYYYRSYAENSEGTAYGQELKFKTPKAEVPGLWLSASNLGENWYSLPGFGVFYLKDSNWIFHQDLGWLYTMADENGFWIWSNQLGWVWTRFDIFPYLWKFNSSSWIYYMITTETDRVFFNATTNELQNYPL
jgi:hypothetical protein